MRFSTVRYGRASILAALCAVLAVAPAAWSQEPDAGRSHAEFVASPFLQLDDYAYPILEHWVAAGRIRSLSPFVLPWRRIDVAQALLDMDVEGLSGGEREWLARLRVAFAPELRILTGQEDAVPALDLQLSGGGRVVTQTFRDPLRPELDGQYSETTLLEDLRLDLSGAAGPVAGGFRIRRDGIYLNDPEYPDGRVVPKLDLPLFDELASRVQTGYVALQSRYARVSFGRLDRNWGMPGQYGFLKSNYAYTQEEIGYRFGTDRVFLIGSLASYGDFMADTTHFVSVHRLEVRPVDRFLVAVSEATVQGGPGQSLDFSLINPVSIWQIAKSDSDPPHNKVGQLDLWWQSPWSVNLFGSLLADATNKNGSCCQMGGSVGVELPALVPGLLVRGTFSALQSLAYMGQSDKPWETYAVEQIGLGWDKTDLYLVTLEADWLPTGGLRLRPRLDVQVHGEGDFRNPRPPNQDLADYPRIIVGQGETTIRPSISGVYRSAWRWPIEVTWNVGVNFISDYQNVAGDNRTDLVAGFEVRLLSPNWHFGVR